MQASQQATRQPKILTHKALIKLGNLSGTPGFTKGPCCATQQYPSLSIFKLNSLHSLLKALWVNNLVCFVACHQLA
jgi:hypothetical protein